jgi:sialate O-acetylesterase
MKQVTQVYIFMVLCSVTAFADVKLPAIISDNMVLQADANARIWGWCEPNENVTVSIGEHKYKTSPDAGGKWMVNLRAMKASDIPFEMTVSGKNTITVKNIIVGQVWLASGQSNMDAPVTYCADANADIANANYPTIRFFTVAKEGGAMSPMADCNGQWMVCSPQSAAGFSAVAFYFGRDLCKQRKEPIGLIHSAWGATSVEAWTSMSALKAQPECAALIKRYEEMLKRYPTGKADYYAAMAQWQKEARELAEKTGKPVQQPTPYDPLIPPNGASLLYNAMISPIVPYTIKGVIWYQGESNADRAKQYQTLFPLLIADWRKQWQEGEFPFLFVQLASYKVPSVWCNPVAWAELRDSQLKTLDVPNTGMAVTIDIGDANNIHPKNKKEVGRRLALIALNKCYGQKIEYSGPIYKDMKIDKNQVILTFDHIDSGLVAKGGALRGFIIAGADRKFVPACASIRGMNFTQSGKRLFDANDNAVVVESPDIPNPVAVRYAWEDNPDSANLCNAVGLPASPFKTDDWPWVTENIE